MRTSFSVVIPALHEARVINDCVSQLRRRCGRREVEIIVVDGDPAGGTIGVLRDEDVTTLIAPRGRSRQMNAGAALARGDVIVFLHADTVLPASAFDDIETTLSDPGCVGGAFALGFDDDRPIYRLMARVVTARSRRRREPFGDQAIFLRRAYFDAIGGYADVAILEDVELVRRIRRRGDRLEVLSSPVTTSSRRMESEGILRRISTNALMMILYRLGVSPGRLARWYRDDDRAALPAPTRPISLPARKNARNI